MLQHFVEYDAATGAVAFRAAVPVDMIPYQQPPAGRAHLAVPAAAIVGDQLDLDIVKAVLIARLDGEAEQLRQKMLTPGAGQALVYRAKEAEARALIADWDATAPILRAEAAALGIDAIEAAGRVLDRVEQWHAAAAALEAVRVAAKAAIAAAVTIEPALIAGTISWATALNPETTDDR